MLAQSRKKEMKRASQHRSMCEKKSKIPSQVDINVNRNETPRQLSWGSESWGPGLLKAGTISGNRVSIAYSHYEVVCPCNIWMPG